MTNNALIPQNISSKLKDYLKGKKMSQLDVVKECKKKNIKISQSTVCNALSKPNSMTLSTLLNICDGLNINLQDLISTQPLPINDDDNSAFILNSSDPAYCGYLGKYHVYFLPTTTTSNATYIHGNLILDSDPQTNRCTAIFSIETGETINGNKIIKTYNGNFIISTRQRCAYCTLISDTLGEMCMLTFKHYYLNSNPLYCTMANAITSSAGIPRNPTVHRICLCRESLNELALRHLVGELRMTDNKFFISAKNLRTFICDTPNISSAFESKILNILDSTENVYHMISERDFYAPTISLESARNIALLKSHSEAPENLKITDESEGLLYTLLRNIQKNSEL